MSMSTCNPGVSPRRRSQCLLPGGVTVATAAVVAVLQSFVSQQENVGCSRFLVHGFSTPLFAHRRLSPTLLSLSSSSSSLRSSFRPFLRAACSPRQMTSSDAEDAGLDEILSDILENAGGDSNADVLEDGGVNGEEKEAPAPKVPSIEEELQVPVPPASYSISTTPTGPSGALVTTLTVHLGAAGHPDPLVLETGKVGRQASGAVTLTRGDSVLYATACFDPDPRENIDFVPLQVEYQERFSSAGLTSGAYHRRDGRAAEHEVLVCRLTDRPLRPLVSSQWRHETQILSWVLSYDGQRSVDALAITASAAALWLSAVPVTKPVAAVLVGLVEDRLVLNPTMEQMERSQLTLVVAGTQHAVLMIEGAADFVSEETMAQAVEFGHGYIQFLCQALEEFGRAAGREKHTQTLKSKPPGLQKVVDEWMESSVEEVLNLHATDKEVHSQAMSALSKQLLTRFEEAEAEANDQNDETTRAIYRQETAAIQSCLKNLWQRKLYEKAQQTGRRMDGRLLDQVRPISIEAGMLPRVHGSAFFTRGETQTIATATLGDAGMKQKIDRLDGLEEKRFYLQYVFPPSSVGETGRIGAPGRREIGHGNLAERSIAPSLPSEDEFPYTIRVESLVTESHGSSSMASVCGGSLALMDAGVPVKSPVAGIAMGMLLPKDESSEGGGEEEQAPIIISDILGTEDALGTMDFKVAGDRNGITAFQLDIKCEGLSLETMKSALAQAKQGRLHILDEMAKVLEGPRAELPPTIPKMSLLAIPVDAIGKIIGPGGKQIRAIIDDFDLVNMDVDDDGNVQISSMNATKLTEAAAFVNTLASASAGGGKAKGGGGGGKGPRAVYEGPEPQVGSVYKGPITGVHPFGVFVEILPGAEDGSTPGLEGLCHVSELHLERVRSCEGFIASLKTQELQVKFLGRNDKGQLQLSRKAVLEERRRNATSHNNNNNGSTKTASTDAAKPATTTSSGTTASR